jgi:hypothetical protein
MNERPTGGALVATTTRMEVAPGLPPNTDDDIVCRAQLRRLLASIDCAEPVRRRAVQDAISAVLPQTWKRRAEEFERARPRPGDFTGRATAAEADERCRIVAENCRNHARLLGGEFGPLGEPWPGFGDDLEVLAETAVAR